MTHKSSLQVYDIELAIFSPGQSWSAHGATRHRDRPYSVIVQVVDETLKVQSIGLTYVTLLPDGRHKKPSRLLSTAPKETGEHRRGAPF